MTPQEFLNLVRDELFPACLDVLEKKGRAYQAGSQSVFANFERIAEKFGLPVEKVISVYRQKHEDAIASYLNDIYGDPESIEGRLLDDINYLFLLWAYIRLKEKYKNGG